MNDLAALRRDYLRAGLTEAELDADPIVQFSRWFQIARDSGLTDANAMTLATVAADGGPRARVVLLKGCDARGFVFFTNYESEKGRELAAQPRAALCFPWKELERQVRINGRVEKTSREESAAYFATRPRGSQLGACASAQSTILSGRAPLEARLA